MENLKLSNGLIIKSGTTYIPFGDTYLYGCAVCGTIEDFENEHRLVPVADRKRAYICDKCFPLLPKEIKKSYNKWIHGQD